MADHYHPLRELLGNVADELQRADGELRDLEEIVIDALSRSPTQCDFETLQSFDTISQCLLAVAGFLRAALRGLPEDYGIDAAEAFGGVPLHALAARLAGEAQVRVPAESSGMEAIDLF
ncbi:hypothetical protein [Pseudoroseicyclus tamaricis]|uniref:Uncharacterized protein n=1 Tax=Pseudoroseicyclus tamaricis TaxID=2705421 RepID=A0A6B2K231_9RHOB|nr:hypothetical protein [Pseudoroseicyclus tamaricis]NDV01842.1 hypothetical protein [Pseudoroseicyclus tamaricis]